MLDTASKCVKRIPPVSSCGKCERFRRSITGPFTSDRWNGDSAVGEAVVDRLEAFERRGGDRVQDF
jgi:hypothetical protein